MSAAGKQQVQQYLIGFLVIIFMLLLFRSFGHRNPQKAILSATPVNKELLLPGLMKKHYEDIDAKTLGSLGAPAKAAPSGYFAQNLRDPFKNLLPGRPSAPEKPAGPQAGADSNASRKGAKPEAPPALSLSGVWWADQPGALINGRVYHPGESIEGATVKEISREGVVMEFSGRAFLLTVSGSSGFGQAQDAKTAYGRR